MRIIRATLEVGDSEEPARVLDLFLSLPPNGEGPAASVCLQAPGKGLRNLRAEGEGGTSSQSSGTCRGSSAHRTGAIVFPLHPEGLAGPLRDYLSKCKYFASPRLVTSPWGRPSPQEACREGLCAPIRLGLPASPTRVARFPLPRSLAYGL